MKKIYLFGFALFAMFMLAGCGNSPEDVVKDCVAAIEKNDMEKIKKLCDEDVINIKNPYKDLEHNGYKALAGATDIKAGEIGEMSMGGMTLKGCVVTAIAKDGMKISIQVSSKNGGDYKISSVDKEYSEKEKEEFRNKNKIKF